MKSKRGSKKDKKVPQLQAHTGQVAGEHYAETSIPQLILYVRAGQDIPRNKIDKTSLKEDEIPNETKFPVPALHAVISFLKADAKKESDATMINHICSPTCNEHGIPWSLALTNLSLGCRYFREEIWRERIRKLLIKRDDDMQKVEVMIRPECRDAVR